MPTSKGNLKFAKFNLGGTNLELKFKRLILGLNLKGDA